MRRGKYDTSSKQQEEFCWLSARANKQGQKNTQPEKCAILQIAPSRRALDSMPWVFWPHILLSAKSAGHTPARTNHGSEFKKVKPQHTRYQSNSIRHTKNNTNQHQPPQGTMTQCQFSTNMTTPIIIYILQDIMTFFQSQRNWSKSVSKTSIRLVA